MVSKRAFPSVLSFLICAALLCAAPLAALERPVTISVWQGPCEDGDFEANLAVVRDAIRAAADRGSDFVVFPETFLSGYGSLEQVKRGARRIDDPRVAEFIAESAEHGQRPPP